MSNKRMIAVIVSSVACLSMLQSCFTGVESTPRISERELKAATSGERREESVYLSGVRGESPSRWVPGKEWVVTDSRSERAIGVPLEGDTVRLEVIGETTTFMGRQEAVVEFSTRLGRATYLTGLSPDSLMRRRDLVIPYMVELTVLEALHERLLGQRYYVTTSLWGDMEGNSLRGLRYIPVEVVGVDAGRGVEPVRLTLAYDVTDGMRSRPGLEKAGEPSRRYFTLPMALPGDAVGGTTRDFANLFSLSDPRRRYPKIGDEAWRAIMEGRVIEGMTRDECRLALGAPAEIDRRPGYSSLQEVWIYPDGIRLVFIDGLLTGARR